MTPHFALPLTLQVVPLERFTLFRDLAQALGSGQECRAVLAANFARIAAKTGRTVRALPVLLG